MKTTKKLLIVMFFGILSSLSQASVAEEPVLVEFKTGERALASDVNANFTNLKSAIIDNQRAIANVTSSSDHYTKAEAEGLFADRVYNFIPNGSFDDGEAGWELSPDLSTNATDFGIATVAGAPLGTKALNNKDSTVLWLSSSTWVPVKMQNTYEVRGSFRQLSGSGGTVYLAVRLRDSSGNELNNTTHPDVGRGTWFFYPVEDYSQGKTWTSYSALLGAGTAMAFPAEAAEMTVGFILNYGGANGGSIYQVQGLGLYNAVAPVPWNPLVLKTNFTDYGSAYLPPQYRKIGDNVCLRGLLKYTGSAFPKGDTTVAVLPPTYIPSGRLAFPGATSPANFSDRIDIDRDGAILVKKSDLNSELWVSLSGICFSTSP